MNGKTLLPAIAAITLAVLCVLTYTELRDERSRNAALKERILALETAAIAEPSVNWMSRPGTTNAAAVTPPPLADPGSGTRSGREFDDRRDLEQQRQMMSDPEYRRAMLAMHLDSLRRRHPDLMPAIGLTVAQQEKLFEMVGQQWLARNDIVLERSLRDEGADPTLEDQQEMEQLLKARREESEAARNALLGEDLYRKWADYEKSAGIRAQVRDLRGRLAAGTSPLQDAQFDRLVILLADENQRHEEQLRMLQESMFDSRGPTDAKALEYSTRQFALLEESQLRARDAVSAYLDVEQLKQLDTMLRSRLEREKNMLRMMRAANRFESGAETTVNQ